MACGLDVVLAPAASLLQDRAWEEGHPMGAPEHTVFRAVTGAFTGLFLLGCCREGWGSVSCASPAAAAARGGSGMIVES